MSATRLPSVLTRAEVHALLGELQGVHRLIAGLLYGSGLRLPEALRLRAKDLDWEMHQLTIRDGKGLKDRVSVLPRQLAQPLAEHLRRVRRLHQRDRSEGFGAVYLPFALERKYPGAASAWGWQFVFPSRGRSADPRSGAVRRHHLSETAVQAAVRRAARRAGIARPAGCHALRHSFAAHLLEDGHDIRTVEELLGHADVRTTGVHTSVPDRGGGAVRSPLDAGTPARSPAAQELPGIILR